MPRTRRGTSKLLAASMAYLRSVVKSVNVDEKLILAELITFLCSIVNITTNQGLTQHGISTQSTASQRSLNSVQLSDHSTTESTSESRQSSAQSSVERARPSPVTALKESLLNSVMDLLHIAEQGGIPYAELHTMIQDVVKTLVRLETSNNPSITPSPIASLPASAERVLVQPMTLTVQSTSANASNSILVTPVETTSSVQPISSVQSTSANASNSILVTPVETTSSVQPISSLVQSTSANASNSILVTPVETASSVQPISALSAVSTVSQLPTSSRSEKVKLWLRALPTDNLEQC